jgi:hypothetical protein
MPEAEFPEAPSDGKQYARQNGDWSEITIPEAANPLVIFGHDECIFKQYLIPSKQWYRPKREKYIVPKDDGMGIMISGFLSREFGFGLVVSEAELIQIYKSRVGRRCLDKQAAINTRKSAIKEPLTSSPFLREFEYGAQHLEGSWTYQHMVLQL